jgi:hypothetical protein
MTAPLTVAGLPIGEATLEKRRQRVRDHADERAAAAIIRSLGMTPEYEATALLVARDVLDDILPYCLARSELLDSITSTAWGRARRKIDELEREVARLQVEVARLRHEARQREEP